MTTHKLEISDRDIYGIAKNMVYVEGGDFMMGSSEGRKSESKVHQVQLDGFYIGKYLVTQAQWEMICGENKSHFQGEPQKPVERVSWKDCQQFIKRLNKVTGKKYRLPTEAEWEYAARGGLHSSEYTFSGSNDLNTVAWYVDECGKKETDNLSYGTRVVGQKHPNDLGLYDMSGNVRCWCSDWYDPRYYHRSPINNPTGPKSGKRKALRGGSWLSPPVFCQVSFRSGSPPANGSYQDGFRLVLS